LVKLICFFNSVYVCGLHFSCVRRLRFKFNHFSDDPSVPQIGKANATLREHRLQIELARNKALQHFLCGGNSSKIATVGETDAPPVTYTRKTDTDPSQICITN
jgi:hypothetical protein